MKKYKVSKGLKPYVRRILARSYHKYHMVTDGNGQIWCETDVSSDTFQRIVQRAKCEKRTEETGVFQVTAREANNRFLLNSLLKQAHTTAFAVIDDRDGSRVN